MNRRYCRKATRELGRTARYHLRKSLRLEVAGRDVHDQARATADRSSSSESDSEEEGQHANLNVPQDVDNNPVNAPVQANVNQNDEGIGNGDEILPEQQEDGIQGGNALHNNIAPDPVNVNLDNGGIDRNEALHEQHHDHNQEDHAAINIPRGNVDEREGRNQNDGVEAGAEDSDNEEQALDEGESDDEDYEQYLNFPNTPMYAGANITVTESMLLILSLMLRHNLTATCIADILTVVQFHCLNNELQELSLYKFKKFFALDSKAAYTKHFYCSGCFAGLRNENSQCESCENMPVAYFIEMPFLNQLKEMFLRQDFYNQLQNRFNRPDRQGVIRDIYDGSLYKRFYEEGFLSDPNNISLTWYTDGVPVFKSSKVSMTPLFLCINELPYRERMKQENMLLAGLWFGSGKPVANLFLNKLRPQFQILFQGKNFRVPGRNQIRVRGILLAGTGDVPAKTDFLNLTLYSGAYGCLNCKQEGRTFLHPSGGHSHIFPYDRNIEERTSEETHAQGQRAVLERIEKGVMGVKGVSALYLIMPDYIRGTGIDVMHKVYGGTVKKLLQLWFDPSNSREPFSLGYLKGNVDKRLVAIRPPKFVHRMPRSVADLCHWKASELKMWFYYYAPPVLQGIMLPVYFNNFLLLVYAISLLNSQEITLNDIETAKNLLHRFVGQFGELYGERNYTINVHGLLHLPECVTRLGPLWAYCCFPFEDLNGRLLQCIQGTSHLASQVAVRHAQIIKLHRKFETLGDGHIRDFVLNRKKKQVAINERIEQGCYSVGSYTTYDVIPPQAVLLGLRNSNIEPGFVRTYLRLLKKDHLFVSESYLRAKKTLSCFAIYFKDGLKKVGCINIFTKITYCECRRQCECAAEHYAILNEVQLSDRFFACDEAGRRNSLWHLKQSRRTHVVTAVPVNDLLSVCVYVASDEMAPAIGFPINDHEKE